MIVVLAFYYVQYLVKIIIHNMQNKKTVKHEEN